MTLNQTDVQTLFRAKAVAQNLDGRTSRDYSQSKQFPGGKLDEAAKQCAEAIDRVLLLANVYFGVSVPDEEGR